MGKRVNDRDDAVDTCLGQYLTDGIIVLKIDVLGKQHLALIAVQAFNDGHRLCPKRHTYACTDLVAGLLRNVLQHTVNDIVGGEAHKVTVTASHHALEDKHVTVALQHGVIAEIVCQYLITLGDGQVVWRSVECPWHVEPVKGVVALCAVEKSPVYDGAYHGKDVVHGVAPSGCPYPALGAVVELSIDGGVLVHKGVFQLHEFLEGGNVLGGDGADGKGVVLHLADAALVFLEAFHLVYDTTVVGSLMFVGLLLFNEFPAPYSKASLYNLAVLYLEGIGMVVGKYELLQPLVGGTDVKLLGDKAGYLHHGAVQAKLFLIGHQSHTEAVALTLAAPVVGVDGQLTCGLDVRPCTIITDAEIYGCLVGHIVFGGLGADKSGNLHV